MGRGKHQSKKPSQELHKVAKQPGRLTSQSKTIVSRVRHYFEREKQKGTHMNVLKKTSAATEVSLTAIKRICSEQMNNDGQFFTPLRQYAASHIRMLSIRVSSAELFIPVMRGKNTRLSLVFLKR